MTMVVTKSDFIRTYSLKNRRYVELYQKVLDLSREGMNCSEISRVLNIPYNFPYNWVIKKQVPAPIKAIESLERFGLKLPLRINKSDQFTLFVKTFAFIFWD